MLFWIFFKTSFQVSAENPVLRPIATINISLTKVVSKRFFFGDIMCISGKTNAFLGWKVGPNPRVL